MYMYRCRLLKLLPVMQDIHRLCPCDHLPSHMVHPFAHVITTPSHVISPPSNVIRSPSHVITPHSNVITPPHVITLPSFLPT